MARQGGHLLLHCRGLTEVLGCTHGLTDFRPCLRGGVSSKCLCMPICPRDCVCLRPICLRVFETCLRPTYLREVPSCARVSSRRRVSPPDLSSGSVFAFPCVFATCLRPTCPRSPTCLCDDACLHRTCFFGISSNTHMASLLNVAWQLQCAQEVSTYGHVPSLREVSSSGMCFLMPTCLRCLHLVRVC